jgi:hypothetical protein
MGHFFHCIFLTNPLAKQPLKYPRYRKDLTCERLKNCECKSWIELALDDHEQHCECLTLLPASKSVKFVNTLMYFLTLKACPSGAHGGDTERSSEGGWRLSSSEMR